MKKIIITLSLVSFLSSNVTAIAQDVASSKDNNPIFDYSERYLNNTDSIPDYEAKAEKLIITGTIYQSDGKTPAKDVILYIFQPDENGNYNLKRDANRKRYVYHRAWIKTDADGKYTFYTFMPGKLIRSKELKQIRRIIKEPGKDAYDMAPFFFNDDPLIPDLTLACRAEAVKSMLRINEKDGVYTSTKDIKLSKSTTTEL
ncbi:dioxygenase family protein [Confluentibacter sediminis]|uniref:dioxygenase family protein n=1 Tax=Confluentibacter sediminis TaxID=2219045 RepID=UPI000DAEACFC|nr:hypothetical protein [Confluentibacter sediminis]